MSEKKLHIIYHFRVRGTGAEGVHIAGIANGFRAMGHTVLFVSPTNADPTISTKGSTGNDQKNGVQKRLNIFTRMLHVLADSLPQPLFEIMELFYNIFAVTKLIKKILIRRPDIIYERYAFYNYSGALTSYLFGIPLVVEVNEISGLKRVRGQFFIKLANIIEKIIFRKASLIIVVSDFLNSEITKIIGPTQKIITIPNGVSRSWLDMKLDDKKVQDLTKAYGLENKKTICFVGGLVQWHNLDLLIEAFSSLHKIVPDTVLLFVGKGPIKNEIIHKAERLGVNQKTIIFTGNVPHEDVPYFISISKIAVIPGINKFGSSVKLLEYMSMGKPVVAPKMPSVELVVTHRKDGMLFDSENKIDLYEKLLFLLTNHNASEEIGREAKKRVSSFTWEENAKKTLLLVSDLINC
jgi:glycosyltransferase involved in cell wall biosynthesis